LSEDVELDDIAQRRPSLGEDRGDAAETLLRLCDRVVTADELVALVPRDLAGDPDHVPDLHAIAVAHLAIARRECLRPQDPSHAHASAMRPASSAARRGRLSTSTCSSSACAPLALRAPDRVRPYERPAPPAASARAHCRSAPGQPRPAARRDATGRRTTPPRSRVARGVGCGAAAVRGAGPT